ncbi:MAG TPA: protein translocase subunit SecF [Syntrophomonas sp.]|nr:protein translocase subunit SecF [Syntrophomonas sp.]HPT68509.1 protein translocase subunit SecF [Syntrophomonas sp.]
MQFIEKRKWFYIFSSVLIIAGIVSMFMQGFNWSIDFTGGSLLRYKMDSSITADQVRNTVSELKLVKEVSVQKSGSEFYIRTNELNQEQTAKMTSGLKEKFKSVTLESAESVGATIGSELTRNALIAIGIALVLMLIYITFRFEFAFGLAAVLALFHDVLIVLGLFSIFQWEVSSYFVAAILTIVGYSINDTIVIFDRVRENLRSRKKEELNTLLNRSIMQTLNRSINTVLTVLMPLITLLLFGGSTIKVFVIALLIGILFGMYSSICVASPFYYDYKQRSAS